MLIFLHQLSKEVRNCNRFSFHCKKYVLSQKKGLQKGEVLAPFPAIIKKKKNGLKIIFLHTTEAVAGRSSVKKRS